MYKKSKSQKPHQSQANFSGNGAVQRKSKSGLASKIQAHLESNGSAVQRKVNIGKPNDRYEKEADRVADRVVNSSEPAMIRPVQSQSAPISTLQRAEEEEAQTKIQRAEEEEAQTKIQRAEEEEAQTKGEEEEEAAQTKIQREEEEEAAQTKIQREEEEAQTKIQRAEEEEAQTKGEEEEEAAQTKIQREEEEEAAQTKIQREEEEAQTKIQRAEEEEAQTKRDKAEDKSEDFDSKLEVSKSSGETLQGELKNEMESKIGADFSNIKVHTGPVADGLAKDIGALAFAVGNHVYFKEGQFNPESKDGKHLLAHELTHTVQQRAAHKDEAPKQTAKGIGRQTKIIEEEIEEKPEASE